MPGQIRKNLTKAISQVKSEEQARAATKLQDLKAKRAEVEKRSDEYYDAKARIDATEKLQKNKEGNLSLSPKEKLRLKSVAQNGITVANSGLRAIDYGKNRREAELRSLDKQIDTQQRIATNQRARSLRHELDNIQRRYRRAAERQEKAAVKAFNAGDFKEAIQLEAAAKAARIIAGGIGAERININKLNLSVEERNKEREKLIKRTAGQSMSQLVTYQTAQKDRGRKATARTVLKAGSEATFYASTKELWQGVDYKDRDKAIVEGFQRMGYDVDDILDVMTVLQAEGVDVLNLESNDRDNYILRTRTGTNLVARKLNEAGL